MRQRKFKAPQRKTARRWRVPPALTLGGGDVFEGLSILDDVPGELGLVLWQSLRDCMLWGRVSETERGALFAADAEPARVAAILAAAVPAEIEEPLKTIAGILGGGAREESVALACRRIMQWADEGGLLAVALAFAQAAAVVTPGDPAAAYAVGRLARRRAEHARSETWYRRTVALARQVGDWPTYALAFVGLGNLYAQRGAYPAARRFHTRALRAAGRNSLHAIEGQALHELFGIAVETGRAQEAEELARAAFEAYGPHHPQLPSFAHDVAYWWTTQGHFTRSLRVLQEILPHLSTPVVRVLVLADIARAAGGAGEVEAFRQAWDETRVLLRGREMEEAAARALLDLAHGALSLKAWEQAEEAARQALEVATQRRESKIRLSAEAVLDAARRHAVVATEPAPALKPETVQAADELATDFVHSLQTAGA
ncbi:MAG TPA: tetratricopeptide repeat protein [Longimicrobium sp.]|nr:tetratricopeptide repeat protein [Longimicrobium sp.]